MKDVHLKTTFAWIIVIIIIRSFSAQQVILIAASWQSCHGKTTRIQNDEDTLEQSIWADEKRGEKKRYR